MASLTDWSMRGDEIGSEAGVLLKKPVKKRRVLGPKVRSGCITCKSVSYFFFRGINTRET